jgi:hypothetical protein
MILKKYVNSEIGKIVLDESTITSIKWINENGIDIEMDIDWCGQEDLKNEIDFLSVKTRLLFHFASDINFNFHHQAPYTIGALEVSEFKFHAIGKQYSIEFRFDFQPVGFIKFICNDFDFIIESPPKSIFKKNVNF